MENSFYLQHDKPVFPCFLSESKIDNIGFWNNIIWDIPPLIRKLAEYYNIPPHKYPKSVKIVFDADRWEKWKTAFGRRTELDYITGGIYFTIENRIELNPYVYYFEGGEKFLAIIYHELAHWVIKQVDYLKCESHKKGKRTCHAHDFSMVMGDIYDISGKKDISWGKEYRKYRKYFHKQKMDDRHTLDNVRLELYSNAYSERYSVDYDYLQRW